MPSPSNRNSAYSPRAEIAEIRRELHALASECERWLDQLARAEAGCLLLEARIQTLSANADEGASDG